VQSPLGFDWVVALGMVQLVQRAHRFHERPFRPVGTQARIRGPITARVVRAWPRGASAHPARFSFYFGWPAPTSSSPDLPRLCLRLCPPSPFWQTLGGGVLSSLSVITNLPLGHRKPPRCRPYRLSPSLGLALAATLACWPLEAGRARLAPRPSLPAAPSQARKLDNRRPIAERARFASPRLPLPTTADLEPVVFAGGRSFAPTFSNAVP